jgi:serine/threonine protein kinase
VTWETKSSALKKTALALRAAFAREVQLSRQTNLKSLYLARELHRARGTLYSVRAFVPGSTLMQVVQSHGGRVSAAEGIDLLKLLLGELARLHSAGLLHGDIKPQNIIISDNSGPKLIDFDGLLDIGRPRDKYLPVMVSQGFAAPELYECNPARTAIQFDASLDLYGLAATLYFCMTKEHPVPSRIDRRIETLIREDFVPWRFASALGWCLARNPRMRPRSVADVLGLIAPTQEGASV